MHPHYLHLMQLYIIEMLHQDSFQLQFQKNNRIRYYCFLWNRQYDENFGIEKLKNLFANLHRFVNNLNFNPNVKLGL